MKILFLTYHGFEEASGISKKMLAQIKGLRQNGHEVYLGYYDIAKDGSRCRYVDDTVIKIYGKGRWASILQRMDYSCVNDYCQQHGIELVYARSFMNASPFVNRLFRKLKQCGIKCLMEVPTYPYDKEFDSLPLKHTLGLWVDRLYRKKLASYMEAIVTFSDYKSIFGQRTINISNGVDFDTLPLHHPVDNKKELHLIGVAEVHPWHGFDRMIHGLGEYYLQHPTRETQHPDVYFHIVGGVWSPEMNGSKMAPGFKPIMQRYGIEDTVIKTLKNREYACRGIPFIYSEQDSDFDSQPYVLKAAPDETPVRVQDIVDFCQHIPEASEIRKSVEHLSWNKQMQIVIDAVTMNTEH